MLERIPTYCLFIYILFLNLTIFAQENGKPFIQTYPIVEYGAHPQNWAIVQDNRGVIYVGNQEGGILEFDGTTWRHIFLPNLSAIRSLAIDSNGTIYVGGENELGYLTPDSQGNLRYNSLIYLIDSVDRNFGQVWSLNILENKVFFQTRNSLFLYENKKIKKWELPDTYHRSFVTHNNYYLRLEGIGLTVFKNDSFLLIPDGPLFSNEFVSAMLPFSDTEIIIGTRTKGLYLFDEKGKNIKPFPNEVNEFLSINKLYHGISIGKEKFAFATLNDGVVIIDKHGKLNQFVNKKNGLPANTVYFMHNQDNQSLWLGTNRGLARIDIGYPMVYWDESYGIDGIIYDIEKKNNLFYIATTQCLSYWHPDNNKLAHGSFKKVEGISEIVWDLIKYKLPCNHGAKEQYKLIAGTNDGIYEIKRDRAKLIVKFRGVFQLYCPEKNPYIIFMSSSDGLYQLQYNCNTNTFKPIEKLISSPNEIRFINEDKQHNLWAACTYQGYYRISFNRVSNNNSMLNYSFKEPFKVEKFYTNNGFPADSDVGIQKLGDDLVFLSDSGIFRFNNNTGQFYPDTLINNLLYTNSSSTETYRLIQDSRGNIWIDGDDLLIKSSGNTYLYDNKYLKRIERLNIRKTFSGEDGTIWFGSDNLYKLNFDEGVKSGTSYPTLIRKVIINKDSLLFGGIFFNDSNIVCLSQTENLKPVLDYQYNSVVFEFSAPYFIEQQDIQYQYMLEGYDNSWSSWLKETKKEYTNLYEGEYTFKVKAKNIYNTESSVAIYKFTISAPWYRTVFAYFGYIILMGLFTALVVKIYTKRLKQTNIRLENIVKERTAEIREKNKELAKLSIVASKTDNYIAIMDAEGNIEWVNNAFTRLHGYTLEEFIAKKGGNLINSSTNSDIKNVILTCIHEKKPVIYQSLTTSRANKKIWTQTTLTPILDEAGNIEKLVTIEADITKIKEYEQEIASQRDALEKSIATKDKFFAIISHDLKSPFNAILGFSEILSENIANFSKEKIANFNEQIHISAKQLFTLVENLLAWSRTKSEDIKSHPARFNLNNLMENIITILQIAASKKNIEIKNNIPPETYVYADENLISTVIRNLLSNAIKFSLKYGTVIIKTKEAGEVIETSISDNGIGISQENIGKLFREDIHFTTQGTHQEKGTGLGLILCKEFIEKNGGEIWVESEVGKGTTFTFTVPLEKAKT